MTKNEARARSVMKLALEALEVATTPLAKDRQEVLRAITALRVALASKGEALVEQPAQRPWVGLTEEEKNQVAWFCGAMSADWLEFAEAIEAKLKEKNT